MRTFLNFRIFKELPLSALEAKSSVATSSLIYHSWLYEDREIKSNTELTRSLKQIQPLLEETVQKKYTTSKMWESFQGPLTWQHFCRLAFKDTASNHTSSHHLESSCLPGGGVSASGEKTGSSGAGGGGSGSEAKSSSTQASTHHQHCYEPEPVPALLVGSVEKEWLTVSPYAIKFWDKLNLEPYSRQKNVAYLVLVPDFDSEIFDNFSMGASGRGLNASSEEKDYINYFLRYLKKL